MKMSKRKKLFYLIVCFMITFINLSCNSHNRTNKNMNTQFVWEPFIAAPIFYPVEAKYAYVTFGDNGNKYPVADKRAGLGLSRSGGSVILDDFNNNEGYDIPNGISVLWLSLTERKYYKADIHFSQELQEKILHLFQEGFINGFTEQKENYQEFVVSLLPKGKIWLFMEGGAQQILICDTLKATETHINLKDFNPEGYAYTEGNFETYCAKMLTDYDGATENLKKNGIPMTLWNTYAERFNYKIRFEFEDKKTILDPDILCHFCNGEIYSLKYTRPTNGQARVKYIICDWKVGDAKYKGEFFFDEEEIMKVFSGSWNNNGELVIKVSKYNNLFDISLIKGADKQLLKKTKIHVFRDTPSKLKKDEEPFYNNHRNIYSGDIHFIGE